MLTEKEIEAQEIQADLHIDMVPGTELMQDTKDIHLVAKGGVALVPQPSADPADPLNWNRFWKLATVTGAIFVSFFNAVGPLSVSPMTPYFMKEWDKTDAEVFQFTGVCILVFGFSNFLWVPIATKWGRRVVILTSSAVGIGATIWRALSTSYDSQMGGAVIHGIAAGVSETLTPMVIADVLFLHERGLYMALYMWSYFGGYILGPIISGVMAQKYGWRSFWWLNVAGYIFTLLYSIFLIPETKWSRGEEVVETIDPKTSSVEAEKGEVEYVAEVVSNSENDSQPHLVINHEDEFLGKGKPTKWQFALYNTNQMIDKESIWRPIWIPIKLFAFPIIEWASFVFSWSASCFLSVNMTQSMVFEAAPYNFSSSQVGYTNFAILVGATIGLVTAGPLSDWVSMRATRKNNGIREPEMRIPSLIPFLIVLTIGCIIVAVGYHYQWHWAIIVCIGYTLIGVQVTSIPSIVSTYAVDSYKPVAGDYFVSATVNKNLWAYGLTKFVPKWIGESGYLPPLLTNWALAFFFISLGVPVYFFGKQLRRWTRNSDVHQM